MELVAEIGLSHEGSLGMAMALAKSAYKNGANTIKFQMHIAEEESTKTEKFRVKTFPQDSNRYEYWERTAFSFAEWQKLINYCTELGIDVLISPFSEMAVDQIAKLGIGRVKIGSGEFNNPQLISYAASKFNKIILSTGMSLKSEIHSQINNISKFNSNLTLLYCLSEYPTNQKHLRYEDIDEYRKEFKIDIGLSDHSGNVLNLIYATEFNPSIIEFHYTFDKEMFGPDAESSITAKELKMLSNYVNLRKELKSNNFNKENFVTKEMVNIRKVFDRYIYLRLPLKKGEKIKEENLILKKGEEGLNWDQKNYIIGKKTRNDISTSQPLKIEDFE